MKFKERTIAKLADMICGDFKAEETHFPYRSSSYLHDFFVTAIRTTSMMVQRARIGCGKPFVKF